MWFFRLQYYLKLYKFQENWRQIQQSSTYGSMHEQIVALYDVCPVCAVRFCQKIMKFVELDEFNNVKLTLYFGFSIRYKVHWKFWFKVASSLCSRIFLPIMQNNTARRMLSNLSIAKKIVWMAWQSVCQIIWNKYCATVKASVKALWSWLQLPWEKSKCKFYFWFDIIG